MRLNAERIDYIKKVTEKSEELELELEGCNAGLCRKCLRTIESVFKSEEKNKATKQKIRESFDKVYKTDTVLLPAPRPKHIPRVSNTSPVNCDSQLAKFRKIAPQPEILHEIDAKLKEEETGTMEEGVIVKDEPLDPEYDEAMGSTENGETETEEERNTSNEESSQKFKSMLSNKETGEKAVNSVIDDLLQKNHEILSSTDTALYKPRSKSWYEEYQSQKSGRMLRPKSPTQICVLMQEDLPNLSDSLVELSVGDANVEDIFEKMKHDVPDFFALQTNEKKRRIEKISEPAPKKSRKDQEKPSENEEYDAFDMEVEEVEDENNYTPSNSESTDKILTPRTKKNINIPVVGKVPKPSVSNSSNIPKSTVNQSSAGTKQSPAPPSNQQPASSGNMQTTTTGKSGNTVTVSSGLCWNCGYCNFVTLSQTFLKTHLNSHHSGKAHKYVAMLVSSQEEMNKIKERDAKMYTSPNLPLLYGNVNQTQEKTLSPPLDGSGLPSSTKNYDSATSAVMNEDGPEEESDDEEYIPEEEKKKYPLTYKCAHCNFNAPVCFKVKEHLQMRHQGCVLYALDMRAVKLKQRRYVFFCHRKNCAFTTKKTEEYLNHSENCTPWLLDNCPENVDLPSKKCLELTRNFSTKISQKAFQMAKNFKASKSAEYACTHCSYTSNNNIRVKKHILSNHEDLQTVLKDLQSHKLKKKTHVYFCRHCLWETRIEELLDVHLQENHKEEEEEQTNQSEVAPPSLPVIEPVEKKTPKQASSRPASSKPDPVSKKTEVSPGEEKEEGREEEEIDLHLEVSEEEMQKMMTEFVKDEAGRGVSPGRPTRKASIEASVRVRAQGHQPPMYRCMHCFYLCFGSNLMRKHIRAKHKKEALRTVDVKKRISRQFAYYCICPQDNCKFVNTCEETVLNHAISEHKIKKNHPEIQKMLQPFTAQLSGSTESTSVSSCKVVPAVSPLVGFECLYCSTSYVTEEMGLMKNHIKEQHPSEEVVFRDCVARKLRKSSRIYMCERDHCDFYNSEQKELELHKLAHEKAHIFECSKCQWFTTTTDSVQTHMETVHCGKEVTTIDMSLDLDKHGQVIKRVGGMIIKQEKQAVEDPDTEPVYSEKEAPVLDDIVVKQEPLDS
uniref:Uncharacterized protein n=1 Tax=Magallana gigas TaxID=29159 RepID=K1PW60_MAGGI